MEAFGFDHALADDAKAALAALRGALLRRLLGSGGGRKDPDLAISEDAVHVEQEQLDFFGAGGGGGGFGHGGDSSIFSSVSGINIDSTICYTVAILKLEREGVSPCRLPARSNTRARRSRGPTRGMKRTRKYGAE